MPTPGSAEVRGERENDKARVHLQLQHDGRQAQYVATPGLSGGPKRQCKATFRDQPKRNSAESSIPEM